MGAAAGRGTPCRFHGTAWLRQTRPSDARAGRRRRGLPGWCPHSGMIHRRRGLSRRRAQRPARESRLLGCHGPAFLKAVRAPRLAFNVCRPRGNSAVRHRHRRPHRRPCQHPWQHTGPRRYGDRRSRPNQAQAVQTPPQSNSRPIASSVGPDRSPSDIHAREPRHVPCERQCDRERHHARGSAQPQRRWLLSQVQDCSNVTDCFPLAPAAPAMDWHPQGMPGHRTKTTRNCLLRRRPRLRWQEVPRE
jgi:hypothetical protein